MDSVQFVDLVGLHDEIRSELDDAWHQVTDRGAFVGGSFVETFESEWAAYCGTRTAIGVANGTDALELIFAGLGIGPGDEVIVPANTFIATVEAIVANGATPRFIDIDPATALVTPELIAAAINEQTAAVAVVHLYGSMPDMAGIKQLCDAAGIALVEDAAQAHGATHQGRRAGSWGTAAGFSFYPGKNLGALGDGGAITTDDPALEATIRCLANHGRSPDQAGRHDLAGRNSRLDGLQAALLSVKLRHIDGWNQRRRDSAAAYDRTLHNVVNYSVPANTEAVYHLYVIEVSGRDDVKAKLNDMGIMTGLHYPVPCHVQRPFASPDAPSFPFAERSAARLLSLPMHPLLTGDEVMRVSTALGEVLSANDAIEGDVVSRARASEAV